MYVVDILPLAKGVRATSLSYYAPQHVANGTLVTIPIQNRTTTGIAVSCTPAKEMKAVLKEAPYEMKQVKAIGKQLFFDRFITACQSFARFSGVTAGEVVRALTPAQIIENSDELPDISADIFLPDVKAPNAKIIQATEKKQLDYIKSLIQTYRKENQSVFICAPTTHQAIHLKKELESTTTIIRLDSSLKKTQLVSRWREAVTTTTPVVVVATASFLSVPRADIGVVIVTSESDESYKMMERPYLDKRLFARHLAQELKRDCILADNILSIETNWEYKAGDVGSLFKPTFHYKNGPDGALVDMRELKKSSGDGVKVFSPAVAEEIRKAATGRRKLLLFVARRGRRPFSVCNDCGETLSCGRCGYPLVLIDGAENKRSYICQTCKTEETSLRRCNNCNSWRLQALGVGIDFVADILQKNLPELPVFQIDANTTTTEKQITKELEAFSASDHGVLITTQLGINRFEGEVDTSVIVTADSLLAIPDLSAPEKIFRLLLRIREKTQDTFIIQTRSSHIDIFNQALNGDLARFYRDQIQERENFSYPPFSYLIKITASGKPATVKKQMSQVRRLFADHTLSVYPSTRGRGYTAHALLQIQRSKWIDEDMLEKLYTLPLSMSINAHPRSLL